jgi:CheY-like chemotaxis protein
LLLHIDRHTVVEAETGQEALHCFARGPFDLVIMDYAMPEMLGKELAVQLKRLAPSVPILMVTAYLEKLTDSDKPVDAALGKPFGVVELRQAIASLAGGSPANQRTHSFRPVLGKPKPYPQGQVGICAEEGKRNALKPGRATGASAPVLVGRQSPPDSRGGESRR